MPHRAAAGCRVFQRHYSAFRDGALPAETETAVVQHLADCERCRRRHHALEFGVRLLRASQPYTAQQQQYTMQSPQLHEGDH